MDGVEKLKPQCYGGEELLESTTVDTATIGITSHRVLVFMPDGPGARFHAVNRPNVRGFAARTTGPKTNRNRSIVAGIIGAALLVAGATIDFDGLGQPVGAPDGGGLALVFLVALGLFDEVLRVLGLLALVAALGFVAWYIWKAGWVIEINVAGTDSLRIPISRHEAPVVERLEAGLADARAADAPDSASTDLR